MRRIAMWSGPRNISTAMMRSWGNREDTYVTDEPFYAHYLRVTGADHPGRAEVIASDDRSWSEVAEWLTRAPIPDGRSIWYQKHMTHHMLDGMLGDWLDDLDHAFLIRDPALVIASFAKVIEQPTLADIGFERQIEIFEEVTRRRGSPPPVIDSDDLLRNAEAMLRKLCSALEVEFTREMLSWNEGLRETDGVWAKYWYANVEKTTGFAPWKPRDPKLSEELLAVDRQARPLYERLAEHRLTVD